MAGLRHGQYVDRPGLCPDQPDAAGGDAGAAGVAESCSSRGCCMARTAQADRAASTSIPNIWSSSARPWPRSSTTTAPRSPRSFRSTASRWPERPEPRRCSASASAAIKSTLGAARPRVVRRLRAGRQAAICDRLHHRARRLRRLGGGADRARLHDLFVRPAEGDGARLRRWRSNGAGRSPSGMRARLAAIKAAAKCRSPHDLVRDHPAAARQAAVAADLPGRRRSPCSGL